MVRDWDDPKPRWAKKKRLQHFKDIALQCPYCTYDSHSNLDFAHHILTHHNFQNPEQKDVTDDSDSPQPVSQ